LAGTETGRYILLQRPGRRPAATSSCRGRDRGRPLRHLYGRDGDRPLHPLATSLASHVGAGLRPRPKSRPWTRRGDSRPGRRPATTSSCTAGTEAGRYILLQRPGRRPAATSFCKIVGELRRGGAPSPPEASTLDETGYSWPGRRPATTSSCTAGTEAGHYVICTAGTETGHYILLQRPGRRRAATSSCNISGELRRGGAPSPPEASALDETGGFGRDGDRPLHPLAQAGTEAGHYILLHSRDGGRPLRHLHGRDGGRRLR